MTIRFKKNGQPDLRSFPKSVKNLIKEVQTRKSEEQMSEIKAMLLKGGALTTDDLQRMKVAGTQSVFNIAGV